MDLRTAGLEFGCLIMKKEWAQRVLIGLAGPISNTRGEMSGERSSNVIRRQLAFDSNILHQ